MDSKFSKGIAGSKEKGNISDDWKELDFGSIEGFLYVGQTWIGQKDGNYFGFENGTKSIAREGSNLLQWYSIMGVASQNFGQLKGV